MYRAVCPHSHTQSEIVLGTRTGDQKCTDCGAALPSDELRQEGAENQTYWQRLALGCRQFERLLFYVDADVASKPVLEECLAIAKRCCLTGKPNSKPDLTVKVSSQALTSCTANIVNQHNQGIDSWGLLKLGQIATLLVLASSTPQLWHPEAIMNECDLAVALIGRNTLTEFADSVEKDRDHLKSHAKDLLELPVWHTPPRAMLATTFRIRPFKTGHASA